MPRPAVLIDTVPPPAPDVLPRMDVAAFVGLADAGPVDVPVAIEDIEQFRDIFGAEPVLAYDAENGEPQLGYLGVAVETFLATGGRRCWVVRVADAPGVQRFRLEGLASITPPTGPLKLDPVWASARSPGIAFAGSVAHTTLIETPLMLAGGDSHPALLADLDDAGIALKLLLAAGAVVVKPGTLLRLAPRESDLRLFIVAEKAQPAGGATQVRSHQWYPAERMQPCSSRSEPGNVGTASGSADEGSSTPLASSLGHPATRIHATVISIARLFMARFPFSDAATTRGKKSRINALTSCNASWPRTDGRQPDQDPVRSSG